MRKSLCHQNISAESEGSLSDLHISVLMLFFWWHYSLVMFTVSLQSNITFSETTWKHECTRFNRQPPIIDGVTNVGLGLLFCVTDSKYEWDRQPGVPSDRLKMWVQLTAARLSDLLLVELKASESSKVPPGVSALPARNLTSRMQPETENNSIQIKPVIIQSHRFFMEAHFCHCGESKHNINNNSKYHLSHSEKWFITIVS